MFGRLGWQGIQCHDQLGLIPFDSLADFSGDIEACILQMNDAGILASSDARPVYGLAVLSVQCTGELVFAQLEKRCVPFE